MNRTTLQGEAARAALTNATRRHFLRDCGTGLGALWWATNGAASAGAASLPQHGATNPLNALATPFAPRAKRVIHLHMIGAPSQLELFDYKPQLQKFDGKDCPREFLEGKRFAFIQGTPQILGHQFPCPSPRSPRIRSRDAPSADRQCEPLAARGHG
jgi:hypothetical protein